MDGHLPLELIPDGSEAPVSSVSATMTDIDELNQVPACGAISPGHSSTNRSSRWTKLCGTIQVANAVAPPSRRRAKQVHLSREDSFLKRFSTLHVGTPYGGHSGGHQGDGTVTASGSTDQNEGMTKDVHVFGINKIVFWIFIYLESI